MRKGRMMRKDEEEGEKGVGGWVVGEDQGEEIEEEKRKIQE